LSPIRPVNRDRSEESGLSLTAPKRPAFLGPGKPAAVAPVVAKPVEVDLDAEYERLLGQYLSIKEKLGSADQRDGALDEMNNLIAQIAALTSIEY
jgi:hypothetical protein